MIVIDPKGDADLLKRMYTEAQHAGRETFTSSTWAGGHFGALARWAASAASAKWRPGWRGSSPARQQRGVPQSSHGAS